MKQHTNSEKNYIYKEGYDAAIAGLSRSSNSYKGLEKLMWYQGYDSGLLFIYDMAHGGRW
jgi:ribosome modulation factor